MGGWGWGGVGGEGGGWGDGGGVGGCGLALSSVTASMCGGEVPGGWMLVTSHRCLFMGRLWGGKTQGENGFCYKPKKRGIDLPPWTAHHTTA